MVVVGGVVVVGDYGCGCLVGEGAVASWYVTSVVDIDSRWISISLKRIKLTHFRGNVIFTMYFLTLNEPFIFST